MALITITINITLEYYDIQGKAAGAAGVEPELVVVVVLASFGGSDDVVAGGIDGIGLMLMIKACKAARVGVGCCNSAGVGGSDDQCCNIRVDLVG